MPVDVSTISGIYTHFSETYHQWYGLNVANDDNEQLVEYQSSLCKSLKTPRENKIFNYNGVAITEEIIAYRVVQKFESHL